MIGYVFTKKSKTNKQTNPKKRKLKNKIKIKMKDTVNYTMTRNYVTIKINTHC